MLASVSGRTDKKGPAPDGGDRSGTEARRYTSWGGYATPQWSRSHSSQLTYSSLVLPLVTALAVPSSGPSRARRP